jgi:hypothetical protein
VSPPTKEQVALRAISLKFVIVRAQAEELRFSNPSRIGYWATVCGDASRWLVQQGMDLLLSPEERAIWGRPFGSWAEDECIRYLNRTEALAALLWGLFVIDPMPPYSRRIEPPGFLSKVPFLRPIGDFLQSGRLRSERAILDELARAEFWSWRNKLEVARRRGYLLTYGSTYEETISEGVHQALSNGIIDRVENGDAAIENVRYGLLGDVECAAAASICPHRFHALRWMVGRIENNTWDQPFGWAERFLDTE